MAGTGERYRTYFTDYSLTQWMVSIIQEDYEGSASSVECGVSPCIITMESQGDDKYTPIKATNCELTLLSTSSLYYLPLFTGDRKSVV